ncbi:MAG: sensor histidine kinase [Spirochaetia bacterium]|nr:sensor histidine kinase [Spirochaetia bacterium]
MISVWKDTLFFLILFFIPSLIQAQIADVTSSEINLIPHAKIIKDSGQDYPDLKHGTFQKPDPHQEFLSFGFTDDPYLFFITMDNPGTTPLERLLVFHPTWLNHIQATLIHPDGRKEVFTGGDRLPYSHRSLPLKYINFKLTLHPGTSALMIRIQTNDPFMVQMELWEELAFYKKESVRNVFFSILYSVIFAMILFNILLYFSIKDFVYASYSIYLTLFLIMHSNYNGFYYPTLWPDSPWWQNWTHSIFIYLLNFAGTFFCIIFLRLHKTKDILYHASLIYFAAIFTSFILFAFFGYGIHVQTAILWVLIYAPFILSMGFASLKKGNRSARYFLIGTFAGFVGSFITGMTVLGFIPFSEIFYHAVDIGMLLDAILLSLALADRFLLAKTKSEKANEKLLEVSNLHAANLEKEISRRTAEMESFNRILAHDLKQPLNIFNGYLYLLSAEKKDFSEEAKSSIDQLQKSTVYMNNLITEAHELMKTKEIELKLQELDPEGAIHNITDMFISSNLQPIHLSTTPMEPIYTHKTLFYAIFRNLIGNSIKYNDHDEIHISVDYLRERGNHIFKIQDNGIGIPKDKREEIFLPFKRVHNGENYEGSGVGLSIVKTAVDKLKGTIQVEDSDKPGTLISIRFPDLRTNA